MPECSFKSVHSREFPTHAIFERTSSAMSHAVPRLSERVLEPQPWTLTLSQSASLLKSRCDCWRRLTVIRFMFITEGSFLRSDSARERAALRS